MVGRRRVGEAALQRQDAPLSEMFLGAVLAPLVCEAIALIVVQATEDED